MERRIKMSLIRVFEIPPKTRPLDFHFDGGQPFEFIEIDWFRDDEHILENNRTMIEGFIERKKYFDRSKSYLVLHPTHTFTINYKAD